MRSKDLINVASNLSIGIPYHNISYLHQYWALDEFQRQPVCTVEIAEVKAGTVIIDNDNLKDDDLTGGTTPHRINVMFLQPKKWIRNVFEKPHRAVVNVREKLKQIVTVENLILLYRSAVLGEPQLFEPINISRGTTDIMKKMFVAHALLRIRKAMIFHQMKEILEYALASVFPKEDQ